jgi:hypothetical protein
LNLVEHFTDNQVCEENDFTSVQLEQVIRVFSFKSYGQIQATFQNFYLFFCSALISEKEAF